MTDGAEAEWVSIPEAARRTGFSYSTIHNAVYDGRIDGKRDGRKWLVSVSSLAEFRPAYRGVKRSSSPQDRFWQKVDKNGPAPPGSMSPCWLWTGGLDRGHGRFRVDANRTVYAHNYSWELARGGPPVDENGKALNLIRLCENKACVNPEHLSHRLERRAAQIRLRFAHALPGRLAELEAKARRIQDEIDLLKWQAEKAGLLDD